MQGKLPQCPYKNAHPIQDSTKSADLFESIKHDYDTRNEQADNDIKLVKGTVQWLSQDGIEVANSSKY